VKTIYLFFLKEEVLDNVYMTKKDLLARLAKFDDATLQKMLAALEEEKPAKQKKQKKRAMRPDNVGEAPPKKMKEEKMDQQQNARILPPKVVLPGTYMVSFSLQLKLKNHGHTTRLVTQEVKITDEDPAEIVKKVAAKYVTDAYHNSEVDILGTAKVKFTEKTDVDIRGATLRLRRPSVRRLSWFTSRLTISLRCSRRSS